MNNLDWTDLFGDDDEEDLPVQSVPGIPGLMLARQALTHSQQMALMDAIIQNNYLGAHANQAMCFGKLPPALAWLETWVRETMPDLFPTTILQREPLFDQAILNLYRKGEGIVSHVDLARFQDGILIVSLLSSCVMTMRPASKEQAESGYTKTASQSSDNQEIPVLLRPGDVLAMAGPARYEWEHGIKEQTTDCIGDLVIERSTRVSITLRKLVKDEDNGPDGPDTRVVYTTR